MITDITKVKQDLIDNIRVRLGDYTIDVEISDKEIDKCIDLALRKLKQRGDAFIEESLVLLTLKANQKEYILPNEIVEIMQIYRRGYSRAFGSTSGTNMDPFAVHWYTFYSGGNFNTSGMGNLVTYELYHDYMKTMGKQMGMYMNYNFNPNTHKLILAENPRSNDEIILLHSFVDRPEYELIQDRYAGLWIENWAFMESLLLLGRIRGRFKGLPGPGGPSSVSGDEAELRNEAKELREQLEKELKEMVPMGDSVAYGMCPFLG